jgi:hypothetical protein
VVIDGYTQAGTSPNTLFAGNNAVLSIEITGHTGGPVFRQDGTPSSGSTIRGLAINDYDGVAIEISNGSGNNKVTGNFIGVNAIGTAAALGGRWNQSHAYRGQCQHHRGRDRRRAQRDCHAWNGRLTSRVATITPSLETISAWNATGTAALSTNIGVNVENSNGNMVGSPGLPLRRSSATS